MTRRIRLLWFLLFSLTLTACYPPPQRVDFATSPNIFRGTYLSEVDFRVSSAEVSFSADGSLLAMANGDGFHAVQLWNLQEDAPVGVLGDGLRASSVALTPDGEEVMAILPGADLQPGELRVWNVATGETALRLPGRSPTCDNCQASSLALSPDGTTAALLSQRYALANPSRARREISLFDVETGERRALLEGSLPKYVEVRFSPDGTRLAAVLVTESSDEVFPMQATLWDVSGQLVGTYQQPLSGSVQRDAHMWRGGAPVVAKLYGDHLELVSITTGERLYTLPAPEEAEGRFYPYALYANATNTRLLADDGISGTTLWDLESDLLSASGEAYYVTGFSPDGRYALIHDGAALVLGNPDTLEPEKTLVDGEVVPLKIVSSATYIDSSRYHVAGTVQFGDDAAVPFEGEVVGHEGEVYVQTQPLRGTELDAYFSYRGRNWHLRSGPDYSVATLSEATGKGVGAREYYLELEKAP